MGIVQHDFDHDEVSAHIDAPPVALYEIVADVTRTPELSPEIVKCTWLDGATEAKVGARFKAYNKVANRPAWSNKPVVTAAEPGAKFAFARSEPFAGTVEWTYTFEPEGAGTRVTESYQVTKKITPVGWFVIGVLFNRKDRVRDVRAGMEQTLERLRTLAGS